MPARTAPADTAVSLQSLHALLYMLVRKQMILTIFVVAVTLGAETEFQVWIIQLGSSTDCTFMLCHHAASPRLPHLSLKYLLPVNFLRGYPSVISGRQEENQEV